jgi:alcohol dehydrogenase class IV
LGKAIALRTDLRQIVIPTTYAGSEVTPIIGETSDGVKSTQTTLKVLPEIVIYDVDLTLDLPVPQSVTSGMNALAHAVEALYARDCNPIIDLIALEGARAIIRSLPRIVMNAKDEEARSDAQYGAWLCGTCLGSVGMSLHHKLCHTLGGTFNLPHAETHTAVLPHALAYNAPAAAKAVQALGNVLESDDPALALYNLAKTMGAPLALRDFGMPEEGIELATDLALTNAYWNPRPMERDAIRACIASAWAGEPPATTF